jgi:hypothetical protein
VTYDSASGTLIATEQVIDFSTDTDRNVRLYTTYPYHMDITSKHIAIMSPVQCDTTVYETDYVLNHSIDVYTFSDQTWTCHDLDQTDVGTDAWLLPLIDPTTQTTAGVQLVASP